ncbi:MAG: hypothetical protein ACRDDY_05370 [Clostridium sp.]|uniref:hypothetical protein n=1 Tax=Clostridium sp. TaxID=1506 RepID=UPI003EE6217E
MSFNDVYTNPVAFDNLKYNVVIETTGVASFVLGGLYGGSWIDKLDVTITPPDGNQLMETGVGLLHPIADLLRNIETRPYENIDVCDVSLVQEFFKQIADSYSEMGKQGKFVSTAKLHVGEFDMRDNTIGYVTIRVTPVMRSGTIMTPQQMEEFEAGSLQDNEPEMISVEEQEPALEGGVEVILAETPEDGAIQTVVICHSYKDISMAIVLSKSARGLMCLESHSLTLSGKLVPMTDEIRNLLISRECAFDSYDGTQDLRTFKVFSAYLVDTATGTIEPYAPFAVTQRDDVFSIDGDDVRFFGTIDTKVVIEKLRMLGDQTTPKVVDVAKRRHELLDTGVIGFRNIADAHGYAGVYMQHALAK